jgi:3-hydroxyisobutyrate dehydrogenase
MFICQTCLYIKSLYENEEYVLETSCSSPCCFYIFIHLLIRSGKKGSLLIDSSTVDPHVSKTVAAIAEAQGHVFVDAPVSGGEVLV